jgi:hypothetical protein
MLGGESLLELAQALVLVLAVGLELFEFVLGLVVELQGVLFLGDHICSLVLDGSHFLELLFECLLEGQLDVALVRAAPSRPGGC